MAVGGRYLSAAPSARVYHLTPQPIRRIEEDLGGQRVAVLGGILEQIKLTGSGGWCLPDLGATIIVGRAQPDMAIESERTRQLVAKVTTDTLAADSPENFPDEPAEGNRMIAVPGAWIPEWLFGGEQAYHVIPIVV